MSAPSLDGIITWCEFLSLASGTPIQPCPVEGKGSEAIPCFMSITRPLLPHTLNVAVPVRPVGLTHDYLQHRYNSPPLVLRISSLQLLFQLRISVAPEVAQ